MAEHLGAKGSKRRVDLSATQAAIARRAAESRATVPHLDLSEQAEMSAALEACRVRGCSLTAAVVLAFARALRRFPRANGAYRDGRFELNSRVNVGIVIASEDVYLVPTVFDADRKSLEELSAELQELARAARSEALTSPSLSGATFTLANLGAAGVQSATIAVPPGQAAAATAGRIRKLPVVQQEAIVPGHLMTISVACDHRILYGQEAAAFLRAVTSMLERADL